MTDPSGHPIALDGLERSLLDRFQRDMPLESRPYAAMAEELGVSESEVLASLESLRAKGVLSRIGAVVRPNTAGVSTLCAMAVPGDRLDEVARLVSDRVEVNHNYEREHELNLWFVVTATDSQAKERVLAEIAGATGLEVLDLPMEADYHIDLGFDLQWN